jgi:hypothetical protein
MQNREISRIPRTKKVIIVQQLFPPNGPRLFWNGSGFSSERITAIAVDDNEAIAVAQAHREVYGVITVEDDL